MYRFCFLLLLSTLIVSMGTADPASAQQSRKIILTGYNSVPTVETSARGDIEVTLKSDTLSLAGSFTDLSNYYYGSAIFYGEKGEQGNQIISLQPTIKESRIEGTFEKSKNTFALTEGQLDALRNGNLYISIMSFDHQLGELRAQLPAFP